MPWHTTVDLDLFDARAGSFLRAQPVENTLLLTTMDHVRTQGRRAYGDDDPVYGWWESPDATVSGAYLRTPPYPALVASAPDEAVESLVDIVAAIGRFNAERGLAEAMAARWHDRTGLPCEIVRQTRLFRLDELVPPEPAPSGRARIAEPADRELVLTWHRLFGEEVGEPRDDVSTVVDARMADGAILLWEDGGVPVCLAGHTQPQADTIRVGPVFTPPDCRRRGYAAALTAEISRRALDLAGEVVLFTDLDNPTSNALYPRLGYRPVGDRQVVLLPTRAED